MILQNMNPYQAGASIIAVALSLLWVISLLKRDASIIDSFWGFGFVLIALAGIISVGKPDEVAGVIAALVILWGLRLSLHLFSRWWREGAEDYRYQNMRKHHGRHFWWRSLFTVFALQGVLMWLVAVPFMAAIGERGNVDYPLLTLAALIAALLGIIIETIADSQLKRFRRTAQKGEVLRKGLWAYTRHPNYFGDTLFWWGIWGAVVSISPHLWWTAFAPALMNFLLVNISGAALLERELRKKENYADYQENTSRFIPKFW